MNKHILSLVLALLLGTTLIGQNQLNIRGTVSDTGSNISGLPVMIEVYDQTGTSIFFDSTITNSAGEFGVSPTINATEGLVIAHITDCFGNWKGDTANFRLPGTDSVEFSFDYCNVGFCYLSVINSYQGGGMYAFQSFPTGVAPFTIRYDFGDGNTSTDPNPTHTYAQAGNYNVIVTMADAGGCVFTTVRYVDYQGPNSCQATINNNSDSISVTGFEFEFYANFQRYSTYSWDFGDGTTANGYYVQHTYQDTGDYVVCLTITDTLDNCVATTCDTFFAPGGNVPCEIPFYPGRRHGDPYGTMTFFPGVINNSVSYEWDFGDGTTSTDAQPTHFYATRDTFVACLTTTNVRGCTNTHCETIIFDPNPTRSVYGSVMTSLYDSTRGEFAEVYLIEADTTTGTLTAIDTVLTDPFGYFAFDNVAEGTYLFKAALTPNSASFSDFLPTYADSALSWEDAREVEVLVGPYLYIPIYLKAGNNPGGPGFISGSVAQGANKNGDRMDNLDVMLVDEFGNAVASTKTDIDGNYLFSNLPAGRYLIWVEIPGTSATLAEVELTSGVPSSEGVNFRVQEGGVVPATTTVSNDPFATQRFEVFPNPARDQLFIQGAQAGAGPLTLEILDLSGRMVQRLETNGGKQVVSINNLPAGMYMLKLITEQQAEVHRIVIARP